MDLQIFQNSIDMAEALLTDYQYVLDGNVILAKCKDILEGERGKAMNPEQRQGFVEQYLELDRRGKQLEQQYNNLFSCVLEDRNDEQALKAPPELQKLLIALELYNGLASKHLEGEEEEAPSA